MRLAAFALIAAGAAGIAIYDQYDKGANYQRVDARISAVNDQCYTQPTSKPETQRD